MAEGGHEGEAQTPAKCEFCEESDIHWKCLNCDLFLCKLCTTKIHSKSKASQGHRILNIKNFGTEGAAEDHRKFDLEILTCEAHEGQKCISFCSECNALICLLCLTDSHQNHKLSNLNDCYNEILSTIKRQKEDISINIQALQYQETNFQEMLKDVKTEESKLRCKILDREKQIKDQVTKYTQSLLQQLTEEYHPVEVKIQNKLEEIKINREKASNDCGLIDKILFSHKARDVFAAKTISEVKLNEEQTCNILSPKIKFFEGTKADIPIDKLFGNIGKIPDLELINTYETNFNYIKQICCVGDEAWIGSFTDKKLQKVCFRNDQTEVITENNLKIYDFSMTSNGDLVLSCDKELELLSKDGNSQSLIKSFDPLFTKGVHVTDSNKIIVGLSETLQRENGKVLIQVINLSGDIEQTYKTDNNNQRMFTWPHRIITYNDKIFVTDLIDDLWVGRVVALDFGGSIKWTYTGTVSGTKRNFNPRGMAVTTTGMLLVTDYWNDAVHILNLNGEVIVCHNFKDQGMENPQSLALDSSGILWVGCRKGLDEKSAKIHVLKFK